MGHEAPITSMMAIAARSVATVRLIVGNDASLPGDADQAAAEALQVTLGLEWPSRFGAATGTGPWVIWIGPFERIVVADSDGVLAPLLDALSPGRNPLVCALDLSEAVDVWRLRSAELDEVLARVTESASIPRQGHASRVRWVDVPVVLLRTTSSESLLLADAALGPYLEAWWRHASSAARS
jgi:hypothetical protein